MATTLKSNVNACFDELRIQLAKRLVVAAVTLIGEHQKRLSVGNPSPHKTPSSPGQYPRLRTGFGRSQVAAETLSLADVAKTLTITIGIKEPAFYLEHLAENHGRLGLEATYQAIRDRLKTIVEAQAT